MIMNENMPDTLDERLRTHLRRELDPHVGSALSRFDREIRRAPDSYRIGSWQSRVRYAAAAVVMLGIGVVGSIVYHNANQSGVSPIVASDSKSIPFTQAVQSSWTQTYDDGTVMVDPQTPARKLRRVQYEKTEWQDPSGKWQSRIDIPKQDVILVDIPKQ